MIAFLVSSLFYPEQISHLTRTKPTTDHHITSTLLNRWCQTLFQHLFIYSASQSIHFLTSLSLLGSQRCWSLTRQLLGESSLSQTHLYLHLGTICSNQVIYKIYFRTVEGSQSPWWVCFRSLSLDLNQGPSCCKARVLTTLSPCNPKGSPKTPKSSNNWLISEPTATVWLLESVGEQHWPSTRAFEMGRGHVMTIH